MKKINIQHDVVVVEVDVYVVYIKSDSPVWLSWAFVGLHRPALAFHWPAWLSWPSLAAIDLHWPALAFIGLC